MGPPTLPLTLLLLSSLIALGALQPCFSIYEDQVGMWDWHQQYIGKVKLAAFQTQSSGRKRAIVATEQNVLASLNLRNGEILWKHVLGDSDTIDDLKIVLGKYALTLSRNGNIIRAWHLPDGQLMWETFLQPPGGSPELHVSLIDLSSGGKLVLVLGDAFVHGVSSIHGDILWTMEISKSSGIKEAKIKKIVQSENNNHIYGIGFLGSSVFAVWSIDVNTGQLSLTKAHDFKGRLSIDRLIVTGNSALALDAAGENIVIVSIEQLASHVINVKQFIPGGVGKAQLIEGTMDGVFALRFKNQLVLVKSGLLDGNLEVIKTFDGSTAISNGLELPEQKTALAVVQQVTEYKIAAHIVMSENKENKISTEFIELKPQKGVIEKAYLNAYIRNDRSHGFRVLIVTEDNSLSLLQQGEVVWNREDGLACILQASTAELPFEREGVSVAQVEHSLVEWLKGHWLKLKATLMLATAEEIAAVQAIRLKSGDKIKMSRDHNGFRKLLIVLTEAGKIYALHTGDGRIVWSLLIPGFRAQTGRVKMLKLMPWQVPHKHALDENTVFLVAAESATDEESAGLLSWVDALNGAELRSVKLSYCIKQLIPLPFTDSSEQRLHLIIDEHENVHLFPSTDESLHIFLEHVSDTYFYVVDNEEGSITGYTVKDIEAISPLSPNDGFLFRSQKLWSIIFPSESEKVIFTTSRRSDEVVHTQAKVLTNQDVLYKYLNKNTLFVATVAPKGSESIGQTSPDENWLVVYIIDTVTGRILHRLKHPNMQGPVQAVFSENWVVYHYFNVRAHRFEMSVIEIYDKNRINNNNVLQVMLGRHNGSAPLSSYSYFDLEVRTLSSFFSHSVKALTVTSTARGITGKQILVGTVNDQVLALDKRFFDPRRTLNPTPAEREDGVIPLTDTIPIHPQSYISHSYQVEGLRGIISVPANLESTSLVFAYGVDLFYTHTAPSRIYDSLTDDFSYALLLITIVALVISIVTTWILAERKDLKETWK